MKAIPGGNLDPQQVYGRDKLIELLWDRLETQSIVINAECRIGKTQILRKMLLEPREEWKPIFRDLEKVHSAQVFAHEVKEQSLLVMLIDFLRTWYRPDTEPQIVSASRYELSEELPERPSDAASMFSLIFQRSDNDAQLLRSINTLVSTYEQCEPTAQNNPFSWLGDGLVKSLAKIDADRVTPMVLESYVHAVEQCVAQIREFDVPLRLFRYGIRYLISKDPAVFVELIQPERHILKQALRLGETE